MVVKTATLNQILASRARATFSHRVNFDKVAYGNLKLMEDWCGENCKGLWRSHSTYAIYWQFEEEKDAIMFMLRWGGASGNELK